ncbi:hypothetical protein AKJ51_01780 [candidate division MSBL1 archaeon SCGC-AAA382A20]|uniref:CoB--CoM heterodisulfide reductase iron-sulfur subunit A n=1 Tax=candidate division MSBL1 archaeon SCGC-AAA382A20 TaxID=1698280 RepID=A0A133VLC7_9EURY|nr:hypothetical protein AKJ51_01780 [candidate division MSBL1 archaeon SCGC-AAA382A20]
MARIGVFICFCGTNIANKVDIKEVTNYISKLDDVVVAKNYEYMCSDPGQEMIKETIQEEDLSGVVVASCSPSLHEETFQSVVEDGGLNRYLFQQANIREQCSWVTEDPEDATEKAKTLVKGAVKRVSMQEPLETSEVEVVPKSLVVGGGIAGIRAALNLANSGKEVYLVEKSPKIGGRMAQLDKTFPTLDCSSCILTPEMGRVDKHPNIELLSYAEVEEVDGYVGNYEVKVRRKPRYVEEEKCTACGDCTEVCPVDEPHQFDAKLGSRKAAYIPFPQAIPSSYTIEKRGKSPCSNACPADANPNGYAALISGEKFDEALELVRENLPFPSICGRVCQHPCETECNRGEIDEPVSLRSLKRFLADRAREKGEEEPRSIKPERDEKVAVVGGGPAGLTCGLRLLEKGFQVTVYDSSSNPGGLMTNCIPDFRLPKDVVEHDINHLLARGIDLETNTEIGKDIDLEELRENYGAVFIGVGAQKPAELEIEGTDYGGVLQGLPFLKKVKKGETPTDLGSKVAIIGGGNVAIDCARTINRMENCDVKILYRRTKDQMPAYEWEVEKAEKEDIEIEYLVSPKRVLGEDGKITGIQLIQNELGERDDSGRRRPVPIEGSEFDMEVDTIILAIGQNPNLSGFDDIKQTSQGTIEVEDMTLETNLDGVFAGGDVVRGPSSIVEAVEDGNEAAESITRYLNGEDLRKGRRLDIEEAELPEREIERQERNEPRRRDPAKRIEDFQEVELGFEKDEAVEEAERCLNCAGCSECMQCVEACGDLDAIDHNMEEEELDLEVGNIIVATGYDTFDPSVYTEYGWEKHPDIITSMQFERLVSSTGPTGGEIVRPSDGKVPEKIVFVQCVGSRDESKGHDYCSGVCCMYTAKHALLYKEHVPKGQAYVSYIDIRAPGKRYDEFTRKAIEEEGIKYLRGRVGNIKKMENGKYRVYTEDSLAGNPVTIEADMVVLATAVEPRDTSEKLAQVLGIQYDSDGFFTEDHPKLRPVETPTRGIFIAGTCEGPKDIPDSVAQAGAAAEKADAMINSGSLKLEPYISEIDEDICSGCKTCISICPYDAPSFDKEKKVSTVEEALCRGCGICASVCPSGAAQHHGYTDEEITAEIIANAEGVKEYEQL